MQMKKFNIKDVVVEDLDGNIYPIDLGKIVGNLVYVNASSIEWDDVARTIHKGEPVEMIDEQLSYLLHIVTSQQSNLILMVKMALNKYINNLLELKNDESN